MWDDELEKPALRSDRVDFDKYQQRASLKLLAEYAEDKGEDLFARLKNVKSVADIGCGKGGGIQALEDLCPDATFYAADPYQELTHEAFKGKPVHYFKKSAHEFFENPPSQVDLVYMAHLRDVHLSDEDYENMYNMIKQGGIVIELSDTFLSEQKMTKLFGEPYAKQRRNISGTRNCVWIKR